MITSISTSFEFIKSGPETPIRTSLFPDSGTEEKQLNKFCYRLQELQFNSQIAARGKNFAIFGEFEKIKTENPNCSG